MFGYVTPEKAELKIKEYEVFKAYYCGLCRSIGRRSSVSRVGLTYDMTFLSILLSAIYSEKMEVQKGFCSLKMRKIGIITEDSCIGYTADMNILLCNRKLMDNYRDDKKLIYLAGAALVKNKKSCGCLEDRLQTIDNCLGKINTLEREGCSNIDEISHYFANLTGEIFTFRDDNNGKILRNMGYNLGKWIYIIDAFDDIERDIKSGSYNAILKNYGYKGQEIGSFKKEIIENVKFTLIRCLQQMSVAYELLSLKRNKGLLDNIIYLGLEQKTRNVLEGAHLNEQSV